MATAELPSAQEIDFEKYRRPELSDKVASLVNIPDTLRLIVKWSALSVISAWMVICFLFADRLHWSLLAFVGTYATVAGIGLGTMLGLLVALNNSTDELMEVFNLSFEMCEHVADDLSGIYQGTTRMPSAQRVFLGVVDFVVLPTVEGVIRSKSKFLGGIIFRIYRWSLGRVVRRLLRKSYSVERFPLETEQLVDVESAVHRITEWIRWAREYVGRLGSGLRRIAIVPACALFASCASLASLPIAILWWIAG